MFLMNLLACYRVRLSSSSSMYQSTDPFMAVTSNTFIFPVVKEMWHACAVVACDSSSPTSNRTLFKAASNIAEFNSNSIVQDDFNVRMFAIISSNPHANATYSLSKHHREKNYDFAKMLVICKGLVDRKRLR